MIEASEIDAGANAPERGLTIKAEKIVKRLLVCFKENPIIFSVLKDELRNFMIQHRRHKGRVVPQAIEDFLRQPWAYHLTMALLREGKNWPDRQCALVAGMAAWTDQSLL